ncbi:MAG TPA: ATP-binding protein [Rhizomicrobium sp.]|nr:ATP-binding protein [Rhizomicrobium sp.]
MKLRLWPRTLVVQLIAVTALAVVLSNIAVAYWFEKSNEAQIQASLNERVLDRASTVLTTLRAIPPESRPVVMKTLSSRFWQFTEVPRPAKPEAMSDEEAKLAQRLAQVLPAPAQKAPITFQLHENPSSIPDNQLPEGGDRSAEAVRIEVPLDQHTFLSAVNVLPPNQWPVEIFVATITAILVASAGAALMARRVVRPLSELTSAASVVARGGNAPPVEEKGPDDVRHAAIAFNRMTEKVTKTLDAQRHLLSAVGHDLRTPITAMRINLEFVEEDELRDRLQSNLDELQELTEQVLSAARGAGGESKRSVDLSALVESLVADLDDMGEPVTWQSHNPAPVSCRPNEIRRAVRNLVENAVAYGSRADVQITDNGAGYEIVVEDEGPGIPEDDRQRVFEPFVRLESSRNTATGGTGLGLTLVKAIAEGHGGGVVLENRESGGLRARMILPRIDVAAQ